VRPGEVVIDLGCAPGSWLQVAREVVGPNGLVLGVDIKPVEPLGYENVKIIQADALSDEALELLRAELPGEADVLLSDMAPRSTGIRELDHARQIELAGRALELARELVRPGGRAFVKASQGALLSKLLSTFRRSFRSVRCFKPGASRPESPEIYIIALGLRKGAGATGLGRRQ